MSKRYLTQVDLWQDVSFASSCGAWQSLSSIEQEGTLKIPVVSHVVIIQKLLRSQIRDTVPSISGHLC